MIFLVGGSGFVGSGFARFLKKKKKNLKLSPVKIYINFIIKNVIY